MKKWLAAVAAFMVLMPAPAAATGLGREAFYQVFTRSMRDSNGDRQGDLKGIEQSLPYLHRLGVTSILMTPIQPSPFYHNYFPDRPSGVDRAFGTRPSNKPLSRILPFITQLSTTPPDRQTFFLPVRARNALR